MNACRHTEQTCTAVDGDGDHFHSTWTCDACGHAMVTTLPKSIQWVASRRCGGAV